MRVMMCSSRGRRRRSKGWVARLLLPLCAVLVIVVQLLNVVSPSLPSAFSHLPPSSLSSASSFLPVSPVLHPSRFCIGGTNCFPRIQRICFSASQVKICKETSQDTLISGYGAQKLLEMLPIMRFSGERVTLPVVHSTCMGKKKFISGLVMVADQRYLPYKKPNPHHEAEKLIPAFFLNQKLGSSNTTLYWFSAREDLSKWAVGFLKATGMDDKVQFLELPDVDDGLLCFEDAVIFSGATNLQYIPDENSNESLRELVYQFCSIPAGTASWPVKKAAILDRHGGTRYLAKRHLVAETVRRALNISVKQSFGGVGSFCDQVRAVAEDDLLIVPHGSQNTNLLFARPGTFVIEVFPFLFYTDALRNLTHAAGLQVYALLGQSPPRNILMWMFSLFGWDSCFYRFRWCKNYARQQSINVNLKDLQKLLLIISQKHHPD